MTSKIQITDEMVERAANAGWYVRDAAVHPERTREAIKTTARRVLEAALNPEEPEIPVSEDMREAGIIAMNRHTHNGTGIGWFVHFQHFAKAAEDAYRTMEKARRKEEGQPTPPRGPFYSHCRKGEEICTRVGHRRKDDPK